MKNSKCPQKALLVVNALKIILQIFTKTFLTSHIVALNPDSIMGEGIFNVGLLYISQYFVYLIVYFLLTKFVDRTNRISFLRIGILVNCALLTSLVFFGETISEWIILTGALCGISDAFYNSSYLIMKNELVSRKTTNTYNLVSIIVTNLINIVIPTVLGFLIDVSTFSNIAIYVVVVSVIQFGISFLIKCHKPQDSKFELGKYLSLIKNDKEFRKKIKYTYWNAFLAGFKNTNNILIIILTIYSFKTNFSLGVLTSLFAILTMVILLIYKKFENHKKLNRLAFFMVISTLPVFSAILFIFIPCKATNIILNLFLTIVIHVSDYHSSSDRDALIKDLNKYEYIAEHQFVFEGTMSISKILSYGIFMIVGLFESIILFEILLVILISLNIAKFLMMHKQRKIRQEIEIVNLENQNITVQTKDTL